MTKVEIKAFVRSPSAALLLGLVATLIIGSLASAGLNTLEIARGMVFGSFLLCCSYVLFSSFAERWAHKWKFGALIGLALLHLGIDRLETRFQPYSGRMPIPPLRLMLPPGKLGYAYPLSKVPDLPLATTYIRRPTGGYAGFGPAGDNDKDDVMFGIDEVAFANLSDSPMQLSWSLTVKGEGRSLSIDGRGKGRWERQLNSNDYLSSPGKNLTKLSWTLSPLRLRPHERTSITNVIGFVVPEGDEAVRELVLKGNLPPEYVATLNIWDEVSGAHAELPLPFGKPPVPANDAASRFFRQQAGEE
jgi:hypothetical protein